MEAEAPKVCVSACPTVANGSATAPTTDTVICKNGVARPTTNGELAQKIQSGDCSAVIYDSKSVVYRCIPSAAKDLLVQALNQATASNNYTASTGQSYGDLINSGQEFGPKVVSDLNKVWPYLFAGLAVALAVCIFWMILMRYLVGVFVWVCLLGSLALFYGFSIWMYFFWQDRKVSAYMSQTEEQRQWEEQTSLGVFIAACSLSGIFTILAIFLRKRIKIAIQIIKETVKAIRAIPSTLLFPFVTFTLVTALITYFIGTMLYIQTPKNSGVQVSVANGAYSGTVDYQIMQYYHIFGFLWTYAFLIGLNQVTIAGAIATWYWARDKRAIPSMPVFRSFFRALRYNLGSIALGSLLIAIAQMIRLVIFRAQHVAATQKNNKALQFMLTCLQCCMACVERLIKFMNRNAYIQMAIHGTAFCESARTAFQLLLRNAMRLVAIDAVADFILFLGRAFVACASAFLAYAFFRWKADEFQLSYTFIPVAVVGLEGWMIATCFFSVFKMAVDTIFLSFCEDCERHDGSDEKPYLMSEDLQNITGIKNPKGYSNTVAPDVVQSRKMKMNEF